MSNDNIWYYGVVDTAQLNTTIPCLLSKDEMKQWKTTNPANWNLLQNIKCENGTKTGIACYDGTEAQYIFGPAPGKQQKAGIPFKDSNGNPIKPDSSGYCKYPEPSFSLIPINIGPPDSSGNCTRNIFYCDGHGTCNDESCDCDPNYSIQSSTGTNVCKKDPEPKKSKYACRQHLASGCSMAHDCLKRMCVEIKPDDPLYGYPYLVDDLGTCKLGCKFGRWAEGKSTTVNGGWKSCDDAHNYQPCYTSVGEGATDIGTACIPFWRPPMSYLSYEEEDGYQCDSISSPTFSYPHGVNISPVGGLPNNKDGGCYWEDEGSSGNYADDRTGIDMSDVVMCGPKWGSWQGSKKPNSVGGNQALPHVSYDGIDAQRGTLIPLSGESTINDDARMRSLCCGGSNYANESCYRSGSACDQ